MTSNNNNNQNNNNGNEFFSEFEDANRYSVHEVIGKGSYGVVCSATDTKTDKKVAVKKITDIFEHVSDATRILREVKLLRALKHPDVVEILHILLPTNPREFKDVYVVFELLDTDLHQVIKANDDLTQDHHQFFLYQLLRGLKYIHTANVYHRDLKPKNILANADCKLKICDFGLARPSFHDQGPTTVFWTDYVATRWYRAPELCGSFFTKYTPAIDIWSIGCIFAEILNGKPIFPGKNVVNQLEIITDILGTPTLEQIAKVRNEKARRFLGTMRVKPKAILRDKFPKASDRALKLLSRLLSFDPDDRPNATEALEDPYFEGLADPSREPTARPVRVEDFEFEKRKIGKEEVRRLLYEEILEYHPQAKREFEGSELGSSYRSESQFGAQFAEAQMQEDMAGNKTAIARKSQSLPREKMNAYVKNAEVEYGKQAEEYRERVNSESYSEGRSDRSPSIQDDISFEREKLSSAKIAYSMTQSEMDEMIDVVETMSLDDADVEEPKMSSKRTEISCGTKG
jgi:mitogen-activated protein kinase 1/3